MSYDDEQSIKRAQINAKLGRGKEVPDFIKTADDDEVTEEAVRKLQDEGEDVPNWLKAKSAAEKSGIDSGDLSKKASDMNAYMDKDAKETAIRKGMEKLQDDN